MSRRPPKSLARALAGAALAAGLLALALAPESVLTQPVYRYRGPDGSLIFSDRPPPSGVPLLPGAPRAGASAAAGDGPPQPELPVALREAVARFPVLLYTADNCNPCAVGRSLLISRGVPFTEKTLSTLEDSQALQQISGDNSVPLLSIGTQHLRGFSDLTWNQYLDAAGYPGRSQLPPNWRNPPPTPLAVAQKPLPPASAPAAPRPAPVEAPGVPVPAPTGPTPENPTGIRF